MEEAKRIAAASTVSSALAHMRVKAGISQNMMVAALDCSEVCGGDGLPLQGSVGRR